MTFQATALELLNAARQTREVVDDFVTTLTYCPEEGQPVVGLLSPQEGSELIPTMMAALTAIRREIGPPAWIAFTADAYVVKTTEDPTDTDLEPGTLARAFAEGDPRVREQMAVLLARADGTTEAVSQTYRWTPADGWEWDEPVVSQGTSGGVHEVLHRFV